MVTGRYRPQLLLIATALCCAQARPAWSAPPADWSEIPSKTIVLLYPGQSSYQWLLSGDHEDAGEEVAEGESCTSCHEGEEKQIGDRLVAGELLEPTPVPGKRGALELGVQVAYDDENAHFRFRWRTRNPYPGEAHRFFRFDGRAWERFGVPKLHPAFREGRQPGIYEDRLSMMIDDGSVPNFDVHGCWITCHEGERDMPGQVGEAEVQKHPVLGRSGLKRTDVRKYLPSTRTRADWASTKSAAEIARIKAQGGFVDLMQWRGHRSNPIGMADDFYVLEYRRMDAGEGPFRGNWDPRTRSPRFMYDPGAHDRHATRLELIRKRPTALIRERNALPFDAARDWTQGDLLPAYVTSRADARGSAADNRHARGVWRDGVWTLVWSRPLGLSNPDDKPLRQGRVYTVGFAVHDDNIGSRGHHVSWPLTVGFGAEAEIEATRVP